MVIFVFNSSETGAVGAREHFAGREGSATRTPHQLVTCKIMLASM